MRLLVIIFLAYCSTVFSQKADSAAFPKLPLNPYETYHFVSFNVLDPPANQDEFEFKNYQYLVPFGLSVQKSLYSKGMYTLSASGTINVQFIFRIEDNDKFSGIRKTMYNSDFFARVHNNFRLSEFDYFRATIFHRSTHVGDDYTVLNKIRNSTYWSDDESNYEAVQLQYARKKAKTLFYVGSQIITRINTPRKPIEFHQGIVLRDLFKKTPLSKLFLSYEIRSLQNNKYHIDFESSIGYTISPKTHLRLNFFSGHIPFSRYERLEKRSWIGLGLYINASSL